MRTEEFSVNRYGGDRERPGALYAGIWHPLTAENVATPSPAVTRRVHVDVIVVRPLAQATQHKVHREPLSGAGRRLYDRARTVGRDPS